MALPVNINELINGRTVEWERIEFKKGWNPVAVRFFNYPYGAVEEALVNAVYTEAISMILLLRSVCFQIVLRS